MTTYWGTTEKRYTYVHVDKGPVVDEVLGEINDNLREPDLWSYDPHSEQLKFHKSQAGGRIILGGNRSGKSYSSTVEMLLYATGTHPYRKTPPPPLQLRHIAVDRPNGIEKVLYDLYKKLTPKEYLIDGSFEASWKRDPPRLNLSNGSFIEFMSYEQDLDKHAGASRHAIAFDEEPDAAIFDENMMRLVDTDGDWWIAQTPVEGMSWVYFDFYQPIVEEGQEDMGIEFFNFPTQVNTKINSSALDRLTVRLRSRKEDMAVRTEGKFVALTGLIYPFKRDTHVIDYKVDRNLPVFTSMDHGLNNPTAWGWFQVDLEGNIFLFHEYFEPDTNTFIHEHAAKIRAYESVHGFEVEYRVGDPSIQNRNPVTHTSVQAEYANHGLYIALGMNEVNPGIQRLGYLLRPGEKQLPKFYVDASCKNTIREFRAYRWDEWANKKMQEKKEAKPQPKKKNDHTMDMIRYFVMSRPFDDKPEMEVQQHTLPPAMGSTSSVSHEPYPDYSLQKDDSRAANGAYGAYYDDELGNDW